MLELQEKQHKRIVMLSSAALVFAAFATWQLFSGFFAAKTIAPGSAPEPGINVYLISCITLMIAAIVMMMVRSFQDFRQIRVSELFDTATGLPSRTNLLRAAESELQRLQLGEGVALVLVDIRRFKSLNHSFGYQAGDRIIAAVAERLASVKGETHLLARYDGDRFAFLLRQLSSAADVKEIAAGIQRAMVPPFQVAEKSIYIDVSVGSAFIPAADPVQVTELVRRAEFALTEAKAGEGNAHVCYSASSIASATRISKMETGLRETLEAEELEINYQPLVDSRFDRIVAVEALARWTHPQLGRVSPADFVALAEELGLTSKMGNGILRRACTQIMPIPDIRLAVNISPRHFLEPGFCEDLKATLAETGMPPERLEIEVTENVLITQDERAAAVIASVRDLGVSVALDDFGTGYSGLSYLNRFDIDRIKIDASFVREIENSISAQSMVATIIHLARDRGLEITVEGVETTGQVVFLSHFGSLWYQGYLFARPMPYLDLLKCGSIAKSTQQSYSAAAMPTKLPLQMPQQPEWSKAAVA